MRLMVKGVETLTQSLVGGLAAENGTQRIAAV